MQKHVNLVNLVKSFPTNIYLQNLASIQKRTSPVMFAHLAEKSGKGSIPNVSTKVVISLVTLALGIWLIDLHAQGFFHWMYYRATDPYGDPMPADWDGSVPFAPAPSFGVSRAMLMTLGGRQGVGRYQQTLNVSFSAVSKPIFAST